MDYALIGCGRISPNHIAAAKENGLSIRAVCDLIPERAQALIEQFGLKETRVFTDYRQMLSEIKPQLTAIATESGYHAAIALDCIAENSNIIIEKPIALSLSDADRVIEAAEKQGVLVCACHQNRFNRSIQAMRKALEDGRFGKLFYATAQIRWNRGKAYYDQALWRGTWALDGGSLMNQCIHNIDLLRWMLGGKVKSVQAITKNFTHPYIEAEDFGAALITFENGAVGIVEGTTVIYPQNLEETLALFGEKGTVKAAGRSVNLLEEWRFGDQLDEPQTVKESCHEAPKNVYGFGHIPLYADVIDAIKSKRAPYVDGLAGRQALELVLGIYQASYTGQKVIFPLENIASTDFTGQTF